MRIGQEEDTRGQRCNEHEEPGEAMQTGLFAVVPPVSLSAQVYPTVRLVAGKLDLDLPAFEPGYDLLQRTWQRQQCSACVKQMLEKLVQCLFHTLSVKTQELACVEGGNLDKVELWGQSSRDTDQCANSPSGEGKLRWDLKWLPVQQISDILYHFGNTQFAHLTQRHAIVSLDHQRQSPLHRGKVGVFANEAKLR